MTQMPQMPTIDPSSPFTEDSASAESNVSLDTPSHDEAFKKPQIVTADQNNQTHIAAPIVPKKGIEVVALRKGFYNQNRYKEDDKFFIKSEQEFGDWMKCVEPAFEKKRIEFYKNKKANK